MVQVKFPGWQCFAPVVSFHCQGESSTVHVILLGEDWLHCHSEAYTWFLLGSTLCTFSFAEFSLYLFAKKNNDNNCNYPSFSESYEFI